MIKEKPEGKRELRKLDIGEGESEINKKMKEDHWEKVRTSLVHHRNFIIEISPSKVYYSSFTVFIIATIITDEMYFKNRLHKNIK